MASEGNVSVKFFPNYDFLRPPKVEYDTEIALARELHEASDGPCDRDPLRRVLLHALTKKLYEAEDLTGELHNAKLEVDGKGRQLDNVLDELSAIRRALERPQERVAN